MPASPTAKPAAIAEQEAERRAREEEQLKAERVAAEKRKAEEDARKAADELAKKRAEQEAARRLETPKTGDGRAGEAPRRRLENEEEEESSAKKIGGKLVPAKAPAPKKGRRRTPPRQADRHPRSVRR